MIRCMLRASLFILSLLPYVSAIFGQLPPTFTISTVAGNGNNSYSGDGGPAINAAINNPNGVTMDAAGNLYIADTNNNRIRRVSVTGDITTVAGTGVAGFGGDGGLATSAVLNHPNRVAFDSLGNMYIADSSNNRIRMATPGG